MVVLATAVGNLMLFQGQEFGAANRHSTLVRPLEWTLLQTPAGARLQRLTSQLLQWSLHLPPLADDQISSVMIRPGLLIYRRGRGSKQLVVALNFTDQDEQVAIPLGLGRWRELWSEDEFEASTKRQIIKLPGMSSKLFFLVTD
jgi:1,4-alpha-glucan branching enzyme